MGKYGKQLSKLVGGVGGKRKWKEVKPATGFATFPDGTYHIKVIGGQVEESKSSGRLQVKFTGKVLAPESSRGQTHRDFFGLETQQNWGYLRRRFEVLGLEWPENPEDLEAALAQFPEDGVVVEARLVTKGEYQNTYVDRAIEAEEVGVGIEEAEESAEEEEEESEDAEEESEDEEEEEGEESEGEVLLSDDLEEAVKAIGEADLETLEEMATELKIEAPPRKANVARDALLWAVHIRSKEEFQGTDGGLKALAGMCGVECSTKQAITRKRIATALNGD